MFNEYLLTYLFRNDILNLIDMYNDLDNKELETLHFDFCKFLIKIDYMYYDFCKRLTIDQLIYLLPHFLIIDHFDYIG